MTDSRQTYLCPGCGGEIEFDPKSKSNKCLFCDTYYVINRFSAFDDFKKDSKYSKCSNCGGNLVFKSQKIATCQSCQSKFNIIHGKEISEEEIEVVDLISPFVLTPQEAYERFVRRLGEKTNIPLDFFQKLKIVYSTALYIPTVIIVIDYNATYSAKIGFDHYEEYIKYVSEGNKTVPKTKRRKVTEWTNTNGDLPGQYLFERNLAKEVKDKYGCDLSKFNDVINQLCKFNNSHEFENYNERFLVGYTVAKFEYNKTAIVNEIEPLLEERIHDDIEEHIVADQIQNINFKYSYKISDDLVYVPVYLYTFEYNDQEYYIAQTGEDGKVFGVTPQDADIEANIKDTMYPFWIYLVASIIFFFIPLGINAEIDFIIKFILLMLNIPVYLYLNSIKNSKIYANQSHRDEQVDKFLKGELNTFQEVSYLEDGDSNVNSKEILNDLIAGVPLAVSNLAHSGEIDEVVIEEIKNVRISNSINSETPSFTTSQDVINSKKTKVISSEENSKPKVKNDKKKAIKLVIISICSILALLLFALFLPRIFSEPKSAKKPLNPSIVSIYEGATIDLRVIYEPDDSTSDIDWTSGDLSKVVVNNGFVTGLSVGSTIVTATSKKGIKTEYLVAVIRPSGSQDAPVMAVTDIEFSDFDGFSFIFGLKNKEGDYFKSSANVKIAILDYSGVQIYSKTHDVYDIDFFTSTGRDGVTRKLLAEVHLDLKDFRISETSKGTIYFTIILENKYSFPKGEIYYDLLP